MAEALYGSAFGLAAWLAAMAIVLCGALVMHWGRDRNHGLLPYLFYPAIAAEMIRIASTGRNLDVLLEFGIDSTKPQLAVWTSRATSLFLLLAASERIARRYLRYGPKPDAPVALILAFFCFYFTNVVSSAAFGAHFWFSATFVYSLCASFAAMLVTRKEGDTAVDVARNGLFILLVASALYIPWQTELVLSRNYYEGLIPGLRVRYAGLTAHANTLGPVVIVFLLCLWHRPYSARWLTLSGWALGVASLLLSQSKTSWVAFMLCAFCMAYFRHRDLFQMSDSRRFLITASLLVLSMLMAGALAFGFAFLGAGEKLLAFFDTSRGASLLTLVGRDRIWDVAIEEWRNHPLFGYGLSIWDEDYRARIGMPEAYHAHNQLFQTLSSAGLVGLTGLVIYAATLFRFAVKTAKSSEGLTLALFMLIFFHSISEVPLASGYGLSQLTHLLLLMVIASRIAGSSTAQAVRAPVSPRFVAS